MPRSVLIACLALGLTAVACAISAEVTCKDDNDGSPMAARGLPCIVLSRLDGLECRAAPNGRRWCATRDSGETSLSQVLEGVNWGYCCLETATAPANSLKRASLELEDMLKRCRSDLKVCAKELESKKDDTKEMDRERSINKRLQELLDTKDEDCATKRRETAAKHEKAVSDLETRISELVHETSVRGSRFTDEAATTAAENELLKKQLREERLRRMETEEENEKLKNLNERVKSDTLLQEKLEACQETLESRDAQIDALVETNKKISQSTSTRGSYLSPENLRAEGSKLISSATADEAIDAVVIAKNKTFDMINVDFGPANQRISEFKKSFSERLGGWLGLEESDVERISDGITWLCLILLCLFFLLVIAPKCWRISLTRLSVLGSFGFSFLFLSLYLCHLMEFEALKELKAKSHVLHDWILVVIFGLSLIGLLGLSILIALADCVSRRRLSFLTLLQACLAIFASIHFLVSYWVPSVSEKEHLLDEFPPDLWIMYGVMFMVAGSLIHCRTQRGPKLKPAEELAQPAMEVELESQLVVPVGPESKVEAKPKKHKSKSKALPAELKVPDVLMAKAEIDDSKAGRKHD